MRKKQGIGNNIEFFRKLANITVQDLADRIGCSKSALQAWQAGRRVPGLEYSNQISKALGVRIEEVYPELFR